LGAGAAGGLYNGGVAFNGNTGGGPVVFTVILAGPWASEAAAEAAVSSLTALETAAALISRWTLPQT